MSKNFELADQLKKTLNIKLYGNSLIRKKLYRVEKFENFDEAFKYMATHSNAEKLSYNRHSNTYNLSIKKRWTDSYNMAYLGCSILSMAIRIINECIYTLEDNGIEVLYSNMDSLFIRQRDFDKFNELFPNSIGNELGQFHYDLDDNNQYKYALEGIFIGRGQYILKLSESEYKIRNIGNYIKDASWNGYMELL